MDIVTEDYKRRVRNLERAVIALSAVLGDYLPPAGQDDLENVCEKLFLSVADEPKVISTQFEPPIRSGRQP